MLTFHVFLISLEQKSSIGIIQTNTYSNNANLNRAVSEQENCETSNSSYFEKSTETPCHSKASIGSSMNTNDEVVKSDHSYTTEEVDKISKEIVKGISLLYNMQRTIIFRYRALSF